MNDGLARSRTRTIRRGFLGLGLGLALGAGLGAPTRGQDVPPSSPANGPAPAPTETDAANKPRGGLFSARPAPRRTGKPNTVRVVALDESLGRSADRPGPDQGRPQALVLDGLVRVGGQQAPPPPQPSPPPNPPVGAATGAIGPAALPDLPAGGAGRSVSVGRSGLVSIHVNENDIRMVLELFSRETGLNILVSPGVQGTISINLDRVTNEEALEAILRLGNLSAKREGSLIYILSPAEISQQGERGELTTRVYHLNYIRAADVLIMLRPFLSEGGRMTATPPAQEGITGGTNLIGGGGAGAGGSVGPTGGNTLAGGDMVIIQDFASNIKIIDDIIRRIDIQPIQVLVEAVILSIELDRTVNLGIDFAVLNNNAATGMAVIGDGFNIAANTGFTPAKTINAAGAPFGAGLYGFGTDTDGFKYGFINNRTSGFIHALEDVGTVNVLASPRVLVLNKQCAELQLGQRLGYFTASQNLTSTVQTVQFLNTGTLLRFRPYVSTDGMIRMEVHPEKSTGSVVNNVPSSNTSEVTTNVMVPDGATIVIGGLIENDDSSDQAGTLGLSRLPIVGPLFRQKNQVSLKRELIVMLTPRIWNPAMVNGVGDPLNPNCATAPGAVPMGAGATPAAPAANREIAVSSASTAASVKAALSAGATAPVTAAPPPAVPAAPARVAAPAPASPATRAAVDPRPVASARADDPNPDARHVVQRGENFWTIARKYYGSGRYYEALWSANRDQVAAADRLVVGMEIVVPPIDRLDVARPAPPDASRGPRRELADAPRRDDGLSRTAAWSTEPGSPTADTPKREPGLVPVVGDGISFSPTPDDPGAVAPPRPQSRWRAVRTSPPSSTPPAESPAPRP